MKAQRQMADISWLVLDATLYPRTQVSSTRVSQLVEAIEAGAKLPPIVALPDGRVLDGFHRVHAWRRLGVEKVPVIVREVASEAEAFALACELNVAHGQPLQPLDQRRAVLRLMELGYERERACAIAKVSPARLEEVERSSVAKGPDGRAVIVKRGLSHLAGRRLSSRQLEANERYQGFRAVFYVNQLITYLETSPPYDPALAEAMVRLLALWERYTARHVGATA